MARSACPQYLDVTGKDKACVTSFLQHGKAAVPHSSTSIATFQGLRDLDQLKMSTQGRVNLFLRFMSGKLMDILGAFSVWAKVLFTSCVQGMRYAGIEPYMLVAGGAWRGQEGSFLEFLVNLRHCLQQVCVQGGAVSALIPIQFECCLHYNAENARPGLQKKEYGKVPFMDMPVHTMIFGSHPKELVPYGIERTWPHSGSWASPFFYIFIFFNFSACQAVAAQAWRGQLRLAALIRPLTAYLGETDDVGLRFGVHEAGEPELM